MPSPSVSSLLRLPQLQRLQLAKTLWLSVADEQKTPVPAAHKKILDERMARYNAGKIPAISHEELMRRAYSKK